jgi:hypothetical protein
MGEAMGARKSRSRDIEAISTPRGYNADMSDVTKILTAIEDGDSQAAEDLLPLVYQELRKLASAKLAKISSGQSLRRQCLSTRPICVW